MRRENGIRKGLNRLLVLVLAIAVTMVFSFTSISFADENGAESGTSVQISEVKQDTETGTPAEGVSGSTDSAEKSKTIDNNSGSGDTDNSGQSVSSDEKKETTAGSEDNQADKDQESKEQKAISAGDQQYDSLSEAVEAAESGKKTVIILHKDIQITSAVEIPEGKDITITDDETAHQISAEGTDPVFIIKEGGTLTVKGTSDDHLILNGAVMSGIGKDNPTTIKNSGTLNLESGIINGGTLGTMAWKSGAVLVDGTANRQDTAVFNMSGGIIQGLKFLGVQTPSRSAAVRVTVNAAFNMSGGSISGNETRGVYAGDYLYHSGEQVAGVNMSGGEISGNTVNMFIPHGGGLYLENCAQMTMTGGSISNNKIESTTANSPAMGGGICILGKASTLTVDGGTISGNSAESGGGIYSDANKNVKLKKAVIEGNTASSTGGGICLPYHNIGGAAEKINSTIYLGNTLITGNSATIGGGIWVTAQGTLDFHVTKGASIYGNHSDKGYANDILATNMTSGSVTLGSRILGGGRVDYTDYNGKTVNRLNDKPVNSLKETKETLYLNANVYAEDASEQGSSALTLAEENADVMIRNNKAAYGGGIGLSGTLTLLDNHQDWTLNVTKEWASGTTKKPVKVYLKIGKHILDPVELNKDNNWKNTFEDMPNPYTLKRSGITWNKNDGKHGNSKISVVEGTWEKDKNGTKNFVTTSEYKVEYSDLKIDEEMRTMSVTLKNSSPDTPVTPTPTEEHTVTFHPNNGESNFTQTVPDGGKAVQPEDPAQEGYTFDGWFTDSSFTQKYDFNTPVKGNIDLYAKWNKVVKPVNPVKPVKPSKKVTGILLPKVIAKGKHTQTLTWTALKNVDGYFIYTNHCDEAQGRIPHPFKKVADYKASKARVYTRKNLKTYHNYKYYVAAYKIKNGKKVVVRNSVTVHSVCGNTSARSTNVKSVKVKKHAVTLKKGKTYKVKATISKVNKKRAFLDATHCGLLRYLTANSKIADVNYNTGVIKAKKAGKTTVYVLGVNGIRDKVTVTVK